MYVIVSDMKSPLFYQLVYNADRQMKTHACIQPPVTVCHVCGHWHIHTDACMCLACVRVHVCLFWGPWGEEEWSECLIFDSWLRRGVRSRELWQEVSMAIMGGTTRTDVGFQGGNWWNREGWDRQGSGRRCSGSMWVLVGRDEGGGQNKGGKMTIGAFSAAGRRRSAREGCED